MIIVRYDYCCLMSYIITLSSLVLILYFLSLIKLSSLKRWRDSETWFFAFRFVPKFLCVISLPCLYNILIITNFIVSKYIKKIFKISIQCIFNLQSTFLTWYQSYCLKKTKAYPKFFGHSVLLAIGPLTDHPLITSPIHVSHRLEIR